MCPLKNTAQRLVTRLRARTLAFRALANNPQQSWGFEGEPPEAVMKILWRRGGQRCYRFGFESTSTLERSDGRPYSEQPPDRRTSS